MRHGNIRSPLKRRVTAIISSHKRTLVSTGLSAAIVAISIALVAYTVAAIEWVNPYRQDGNTTVIVYGQNTTDTYPWRVNATWRNEVYYNAAELNMDDIYATLAAGVLGVLGGLALLALTLCLDQQRMLLKWDLRGRFNRSLRLTPSRLILILDALLTLVFLAICAAVWIRFAQSPWPELWNLPRRQLNHIANIGPEAGMTFERWNCAFSGYIPRHGASPSDEEVYAQCRKAALTRHLTVPLAVLALVRLSLRPICTVCGWIWQPIGEFLEWKEHTREMREGKTGELDRSKGARTSDVEAAGRARDSVHGDDSMKDYVELPAWRMSRVEMSEDTAVVEMPGAEGGKEMDAGVHAAEKDASSRS